jgi:hypothetical protein
VRDHREGKLGSEGRGLATHRTGGKIAILIVDDVGDVSRGECELRHPNRVEDQAHAVALRAEHQGVSHARQPLNVIEHPQDRIVGEKQGVVPRIAGLQGQHRQEIRGHLSHRDAPADDLGRQLRLGQLLAILRLDGGDIDIGPDLEG